MFFLSQTKIRVLCHNFIKLLVSVTFLHQALSLIQSPVEIKFTCNCFCLCLLVFWFSDVRHSSLWNFIQIIKGFQVAKENYVRDMENGGAPPRRRRKWCVLERRINTSKEQYRNGKRNADQYWQAATHLTVKFH